MALAFLGVELRRKDIGPSHRGGKTAKRRANHFGVSLRFLRAADVADTGLVKRDRLVGSWQHTSNTPPQMRHVTSSSPKLPVVIVTVPSWA